MEIYTKSGEWEGPQENKFSEMEKIIENKIPTIEEGDIFLLVHARVEYFNQDQYRGLINYRINGGLLQQKRFSEGGA